VPNHRFNGPYRQSLLKLYSQCPRRFRLIEVDGVEVHKEKSTPLLIGSYVHKILNDFHHEKKVDLQSYDIPPEILQEVSELVEAYVQHNTGLDIVHSEIEFAFNINSYEIAGTIDLIYRNTDGKMVLRDIKTDSTEPSPEFLARDIQFSIYYLGAVRGLNIKPDLIEWYHARNLVPYKRKTTKNGVQFQAGDVRGDPSIPVSRQVEDIAAIEKEIKYIIQGIRFNIFPMRPLKTGHLCPCNACEVNRFCKPHGEIVNRIAEHSDLQGFEQYF